MFPIVMTKNANESAGGPQDEDANGDADNVEMIVDPPDHLVAAEMAEGPQDLGQARAINSIRDAVKSVASGVSLQEQGKYV